MTETSTPLAAGGDAAPPPHVGGHEGHHPSPLRIWAILCVLLVVSVVGPVLEIRVVTLLTAFGIALVKAYLVAKHFMHVGLERRFVAYLLVGMLAIMALMVGALAPDVLKHDGHRWENVAAKEAVKRGEQAAQAAEPQH